MRVSARNGGEGVGGSQVPFHFGFAALAVSTSSVSLMASLILVWLLHLMVQGIGGRYLAAQIAKVAIATAAMVLPVWFCTELLTRRFGSTQTADILNLAVCLPVGVLSFLGAAALLRMEEIGLARRSLQGLAKKWTTARHARIHNK